MAGVLGAGGGTESKPSSIKTLSKTITKNGLDNRSHYKAPQKTTRVSIKFVGKNGYYSDLQKYFSIEQFKQKLRDGDSQDGWDFAILDLDDHEFKQIPSLNIADNDDYLVIGKSIVLFGFHFDSSSLAMHSGYVSSSFQTNEVFYTQLDASINNGNSGGPLINPQTMEVIGIVTRKATGLSKQFELLQKSFDSNIKVLASRMGGAVLSGVDPIGVLKVTQEQLKLVSEEIERSANVGVGYAYRLSQIRKSLVGLEERIVS